MNYASLDPELRQAMLAELDADVAAGRVYLSPRLNFAGEEHWEPLLRAAVERHDACWLAENLEAYKYLRKTEKQRFVTARIPFEAPQTLADSEFNRYYSRALCQRALAANQTHVVVRAGRDLSQAPEKARELVGRSFAASELHASLQTAKSVDEALKLRCFEPTGLTVALAGD